MERPQIEDLVLSAIRRANAAREASSQLEVSPTAPLFHPGSPLDSLGLVALLADIEDALHDEGIDVLLSDERAMSQSRSPFRSVSALVDFLMSLLETERA